LDKARVNLRGQDYVKLDHVKTGCRDICVGHTINVDRDRIAVAVCYGYIPNRKGVAFSGDPRDAALRRALYSCAPVANEWEELQTVARAALCVLEDQRPARTN
jgi:hypothetical protein